MTISDQLMTAILAFDTYNHRAGKQIKDVPDQIGTATRQQIPLPAEWEVGFSAEAYSWHGTTVIAYRGTDDFGTDVASAYGIAAGLPHSDATSTQGRLALEFYRSVMQLGPNDDPRTADVTLTGHSLGGGLAGYVAS